MAKKLLTDNFSEPLNGATAAQIDIQAGTANLTVGGLSGEEMSLARGSLQYFEKQGAPSCAMASKNSRATLKLMGGYSEQFRSRLPWAACSGATEWQVGINPAVSADITAHSDGGNIELNLADMTVTSLSTGTGGGNIDIILPANAGNLSINAKTGAGNVTVCIPPGSEARILATTGLGKAIVDQRFSKIDKNTYQSAGFDSASSQVEITASSGAGNVIIK